MIIVLTLPGVLTVLAGQAAASGFPLGGHLLGGHPGLVLREPPPVGDSEKGKKEEAGTHSARPRHSLGLGTLPGGRQAVSRVP